MFIQSTHQKYHFISKVVLLQDSLQDLQIQGHFKLFGLYLMYYGEYIIHIHSLIDKMLDVREHFMKFCLSCYEILFVLVIGPNYY